jgi:hypothetical protein
LENYLNNIKCDKLTRMKAAVRTANVAFRTSVCKYFMAKSSQVREALASTK